MIAHGAVASTGARESGFPPVGQPIAADRALEEAIRVFGRGLRRKARQIARRNGLDPRDLYQEALIYIWQLDPSRFAVDEFGYLRRAAIRRMIRLGRREDARHRNLPIAVRF